MTIQVGSHIGEYELNALLGRGGQASVYKAWQPSLKRYVAIKVLAENMADDPQFAKRFEREAQANARLRHPNIVGIHTVGEVEHRPYIVMDYLEGQSMRDWLRARSFSTVEFLQILRQVAAALDYAHTRSLVHRDVKPANVMLVDNNRQAILTDFGIAKALDEAAGNLTGTGMSIGTPIYMSPEQGMSEDSVGPASDIYSLGIIAYEALAGRTPFEGGSTWQVLSRHANEPPPNLTNFNADIPPLAEEVIRKALAKKPADRYQTATRFADELAVALGHSNPTGLNSTQLSVARNDPQTVPLAQTPPGGISSNMARPTTPPGGFQPANNTIVTPEPGPTNLRSNYPTSAPARKGGLALPLVIGGLVLAVAVIAVVLFVVLTSGQNSNNGVTKTIGGNQDAATVTAQAAAVATASAESGSLKATATAAGQAGNVSNPTQSAIETQLGNAYATQTALAQPTPTSSVVPATETPAPPPTETPPPPPTAIPRPAFVADVPGIGAAVDALKGKSSVLIILPDGTEAKDDDKSQQMAAASLIKLWIVATFYEAASKGSINLNERYSIRAEDRASGTGVLQNQVGTSYTWQEFINITLRTSDNTGANILLTKLGNGNYQQGFARVNSYISNQGYGQTKIQRRLGFLDANNDNFTSANDCIIYLQRLIGGSIVDKTSSDKIIQALLDRANYSADQDFFGPNLPGGTPYLHISGTGPNAANEVGYFEVNGQKVLIAMLTLGTGNESASRQQVAQAIGKIFQAIRPG